MLHDSTSSASTSGITNILSKDLLYTLIDMLVLDVANLQREVLSQPLPVLESKISKVLKRVFNDKNRKFSPPDNDTKGNLCDVCFGGIIAGYQDFKAKIVKKIETLAKTKQVLTDNDIAQFTFRAIYYAFERYQFAINKKDQRHIYAFHRLQQCIYKRAQEFGLFYGNHVQANHFLNKILLLYVSTLQTANPDPKMPSEPIETINTSTSPIIKRYNKKKVQMTPTLAQAVLQKIEADFGTDQTRGPAGITLGVGIITRGLNLNPNEFTTDKTTLRNLYGLQYPEKFVPQLIALFAQSNQNFAFGLAAKILNTVNVRLAAGYGIQLKGQEQLFLPLTTNTRSGETELRYIFTYTECVYDEDFIIPGINSKLPRVDNFHASLTKYGLSRSRLALVISAVVDNCTGDIISLKIQYVTAFLNENLNKYSRQLMQQINLKEIAKELKAVWKTPPSTLDYLTEEDAENTTIYRSNPSTPISRHQNAEDSGDASPGKEPINLNLSNDSLSAESPAEPFDYSIRSIKYYTDEEDKVLEEIEETGPVLEALKEVGEEIEARSFLLSETPDEDESNYLGTDEDLSGPSNSSSTPAQEPLSQPNPNEGGVEHWLLQKQTHTQSGKWLTVKPAPFQSRQFVRGSPVHAGAEKTSPPSLEPSAPNQTTNKPGLD
jgi:hypothetical protein